MKKELSLEQKEKRMKNIADVFSFLFFSFSWAVVFLFVAGLLLLRSNLLIVGMLSMAIALLFKCFEIHFRSEENHYFHLQGMEIAKTMSEKVLEVDHSLQQAAECFENSLADNGRGL